MSAPALSIKAPLFCGLLILFGACSSREGNYANNSQTYYLRGRDSDTEAAPSVRKSHPSSAVKSARTPPPSSQASLVGSTASPDSGDPGQHPADSPEPSGEMIYERVTGTYSEQFAELQKRLIKRINEMPNDKADSTCLILQIIPREQVFDRSVNARAKLLNYVRIVNSLDDLRDIEKAMNGPRG
jgi:hypothetical protein